MSIFTMKYSLDDKESPKLLKVWRDTALEQLSDHSPQEAQAFFDLIKRLPGMFMKHHVFVVGVASDYVQSQRIRTEKSLNAVSRQDCISPYLEREQLDLYINFVGLPRVITEINYAYCEGLIIGQAAMSKANAWINQCPDDWVEGLHRTLYPMSSPLMINPAKVDNNLAKVDNNLAKVDNEPKTVISSEPEQPEIVNEFKEVLLQDLPPVRIQNTTPVREFTDAPKVNASISRKLPPPKTALNVFLSDPYESRSIPGAQRTGKSYFAAVASKKISESLGTKIYHLNLASFGEEDDLYWQHAHESIRCDITVMDSYDASYYIAEGVELVKRFYADPDPAIFICDEFAYLGSTGNQHKDALEDLLKIIADKISVMASNGKKRFKAIWTIFPEFVAGTLTQDAKAIKKLTLCYLSIHIDRTVDWNGQKIGFSHQLFDQISRNYDIQSPINLPDSDRVAYIGGWMPIGELGSLESPIESKAQTLAEYLEPLLREKFEDGKNITQVYRYIDSIMQHKFIIESGATKNMIEELLIDLSRKLTKVAV